MNSPTSPKPRQLHAHPLQGGVALFVVVPMAILVMALMVAFVGTRVEHSRTSVGDHAEFRAQAAAHNAASMAIAALWGDFEQATTGTPTELRTLRTHLDDRGLTDQAALNSPVPTAFKNQIGLPTTDEGDYEIGGVEIEKLEIYRTDGGDFTEIVIAVDAVARRGLDGSPLEQRSSIQEVYKIARPAPARGTADSDIPAPDGTQVRGDGHGAQANSGRPAAGLLVTRPSAPHSNL